MIFVTVGSSANGFDRVVAAVDKLKSEGILKDRVVAQIGNGKYKPKKIETVFKFKDWGEIEGLNKKADMIISHAGAGTIMTVLRLGKPVICMPRLKELKEHTDNHQLDIARVLEKEGKILVAKNEGELFDCIAKVKNGWRPKISKSTSRAVIEIAKFLDSQ
jgi:UDP-N-acetylglucosamine transferase subunit ALG13